MKRSDIIQNYARQQKGGPYIYGATAKICTPRYRQELQKQYPAFAAIIAQYCPVLSGKQPTCSGCKYNGRPAHDCAQLTRFAAQAAGIKLPSGAKSQFNADVWGEEGTIDQLPPGRLAQLFRVTPSAIQHTGLGLGDGTAIDARGHKDGVMHQPISKYPWTHFKIYRDLDKEMAAPPVTMPAPAKPAPSKPVPAPAPDVGPRLLRVIPGRPLMQGDDVLAIQKQLIGLGYPVGSKGADSIFGHDTKAAVIGFQRDRGLVQDGEVGEAVRVALASATQVPPARFSASLHGLTQAQVNALVAAWPQAQIVKTQG